jgi:hypothetical protein
MAYFKNHTGLSTMDTVFPIAYTPKWSHTQATTKHFTSCLFRNARRVYNSGLRWAANGNRSRKTDFMNIHETVDIRFSNSYLNKLGY